MLILCNLQTVDALSMMAAVTLSYRSAQKCLNNMTEKFQQLLYSFGAIVVVLVTVQKQ